MSDPQGGVEFGDETIIRHLYEDLPVEHFLNTSCAAKLCGEQVLVPFTILNPRQIISPRVTFVSFPYEWCDAQLADAAELTLSISEKILKEGFELKDASAWNVVFDGCRPLFCDHLSFQKIQTRRWWAFGQFVRHFVLPLYLAKYRKLNAYNIFKVSRDGIAPDQAHGLIGALRFFTRCWPLLISLKRTPVAYSSQPNSINTEAVHKNLYSITRWFLNGATVKKRSDSTWINYVGDRHHYSSQSSQKKLQTIENWLVSISPRWVTDLGCNTGEFSKLSVACGAKCVAIDLDHECIQSLYLSSKELPIFPVVANLDDLSGGRGWGGAEFSGLLSRLTGHSDVLLMLALIHHLAISSAVPYQKIAEMAAMLTKRYLIVELLDSSDSLVLMLSQQRDRQPNEFGINLQREAFGEHFVIKEEVILSDSGRYLVLMEKIVR
jgi:hypothetical protein